MILIFVLVVNKLIFLLILVYLDGIWLPEHLVNLDWGNGLVPDGTKPFPQQMLTYHQ